MAITDWPADERPREKLLQQGVQALSDAELLAIFLRTGVRGKTAVDLAKQLITHFQGLRGILEADCEAFCKVIGLGLAKYVQLQACLEIARRHLYASLQKGQIMQDPLTTAHYLLSQLRKYNREVFAALFLDNGHRLIAYEELFFGSIREIAVHPRELIQRALFHNAAAVIVAHNHPSGDVKPSQADKILTEKLKSVLALLDISLLDHFIVGDGKVLSFEQEGLLRG